MLGYQYPSCPIPGAGELRCKLRRVRSSPGIWLQAPAVVMCLLTHPVLAAFPASLPPSSTGIFLHLPNKFQLLKSLPQSLLLGRPQLKEKFPRQVRCSFCLSLSGPWKPELHATVSSDERKHTDAVKGSRDGDSGLGRVLLNQTWVHSPAHNKANLLTPGCGEGKWSVYYKA